MHSRRIITALSVLPVLACAILWDHGDKLTAVAASLCFAFAQAEMVQIMGVKQSRLLIWWQNCLAFLIIGLLVQHHYLGLLVFSILFFWGSCLISLLTHLQGYRREVAFHALLFVYLLIPLSCIVFLRSLVYGQEYLFFMLTVSCCTDIGAYYGGRLWGQCKLAPQISPNKTWEGFFSGIALSLIVLSITAAGQFAIKGQMLWIRGSYPFIHLVVLTVVISILGQLGDLFESALKRDAQMKDSGSSLTGHGGFLDMMDGMLWIAPAMLVYVVLMQ